MDYFKDVFYISSGSCKEVVCNTNKTCVIRKGGPKCVCSSRCKEGKMRHRGPVCGTDGRSYHNICRLKKRACRRRSTTLSVDYQGVCQSDSSKYLSENKFSYLKFQIPVIK